MSALTIRNVTKRFGERTLFSNLTADLPERGLYLLLGDSGTGKTTLLRMIAGLDSDFEGEILGGGKEAVSVAFQEHRLLPALSALRNVSEPLRAAGMSRAEAAAAAKEALLSVDLSEEAHALRPAALSGGMRQRVSLARAFAVKRKILLLDEPEKELDEPLRERIAALIAKEAEERLVIVVTHTPERLLPFSDGVITIEGEKRNTP